MRLKIAARSSDLARVQALQVARALKTAQPDISIEFEFRDSLGDQNPEMPLASSESKGVFTQDFFEDLKAGRCDMVVHSWKDLPTETRPETCVAATLARGDCRDLLLVPNSIWSQTPPRSLKIMSSSPRRAHNLQNLRELLPVGSPGLEFVNVRGNVPTRIEKMVKEGCGLILAKAALDRLLSAPEPEFQILQKKLRDCLAQCRFMVLPLTLDPPAAAQGALAIEIGASREDLKQLLQKINSPPDFETVREERGILQSHGGGCHQKIGVAVLNRPYGKWTVVRGVTDAGVVLNQNSLFPENRLPKALTMDRIFPGSALDSSWFDREPIPPGDIAAEALWVARAEAWPKSLRFQGKVVWTSGVQSWKKMALEGVWVNGCAEGLGHEDPRLSDICGSLQWLKLTHSESPEAAEGMPLMATYRLLPKGKGNCPDLRGKTHFFWMSSSSFQRAWSLFPQVLEKGYHGCGPGLTYDFLRQQKVQNTPKVFLSLEAFLHEVIPS